MDLDEISKIVSSVNLPLNDVQFAPRIFTAIAERQKLKRSKEEDNLKKICEEEFDEISRLLDKTNIQDSCSVRNILKTRRLANLLIDDKGELKQELLPKAIAYMREYLYSLGPNRQYDSKRQEKILTVLSLLTTNKTLAILLKTISKPYAHKFADSIIRDTLQLPENVMITDAHARRAVLSAWMCYLRQNIGSCFATAPCILIHDEQPAQFLTDIRELLATGRLKRTFSGVEYSVPLSISWGGGDLRRLVLIPTGEASDYSNIWMSPGFIEAFEGGGFIDKALPFNEKIEKSKQLVQKFLKSVNDTYLYTSVEGLLRKIFMKEIGVTEQEVYDYEHRPRSMIQDQLLMQVPKASKGIAGKGALCANYLTQIEKAMNAFKGIADNALLKAWEFTIASFSENKAGFTRWNLYSSLGFGAQEPGGIGACLFEIIKRKLDRVNEQIQEFQIEYEQIYSQIKYMESRIQHAQEKEAQWLRVEYQSKRNEFYTFQELRDKQHRKATVFAEMFNFLIKFYDQMFPLYFQEVYDADMHDVSAGPYDDSPAGFRLIYKHGRSNTSQWTRIRTPDGFIDSLANFFVASETELATTEEFEGLREDLSEINTAIITHIKSKVFLETAFHRMATAHQTRMIKDPLEHLDKIEKKPWAYTSGGSMDTLVSCYYRREQKPTEVSRWVENPMELLVFLIDTIKQIPPKTMQEFIINPDKSLLMQSPTHAFLLKPGLSPLKEGWQSDALSYIWARDEFVSPMQKFIDQIYLDEDKMDYLIHTFLEKVPDGYQYYCKQVLTHIYGVMRVSEFRDTIIDRVKELKSNTRSVLTPDDVDSILYSALPLFNSSELKDRLEKLFAELPIAQNKAELDQIIDLFLNYKIGIKILSAKDLREICLSILCLLYDRTALPVDYHRLITQAAQKLGYAMPSPIIFADTNWVKEEFSLLVNPGSGALELWRTGPNGSSGAPMSVWEQWLNGSRRDVSWGVYTRPHEYAI